MEIKNTISILFFFITTFFSSQIYDRFPEGQHDYVGGNVAYYSDFHKIILEKKLMPCEKKDEYYNFKIVVYPDATIKFIKDEDSLNVAQNKCAFELAKEVAVYQKGWNPAMIDGKKVAAITSFMIFPDDLFENYKEGYDAMNELKMAEYVGGINEFRKKVANNVDLSRFKFDGKFQLIVTFIINKDGSMSDVSLVQSSGLKEFDNMIITTISHIKNKWKPATLHDKPVRYRFKLPLTFNSE